MHPGFLLKQDEFITYCAVDKHTKISVKIRISADIQMVKYWLIILVANTGGRIYRSVSSTIWESSIIEAERSFIYVLCRKCDELWI